MPGKILEMKPIIADASVQQEAPKQISKSEALKGFRESKPGSPKKEEVASVLEDQIKKIEELDSKDDFAIVAKSEDDSKDELKELTGGVNVVFSSKAKKAWEEMIATLSDNLANSSPKTKALIYKAEAAPIIANLFQLISIKSEDSEDMLKPVQSEARALLEEAVRYGSGSNSIEFSDLNSVLSILSGNGSESIRGTINLINSQGLDKLVKADSGFIAKLSRSSGKLGKELAKFVHNKVLALTTKPLQLLGDSEVDPDTVQALQILKEDIFNKVQTKLEDELAKKGKTLDKVIGEEDKDFIPDFLAKLKTAYTANEQETVEASSRELGKLILEKHSRIRGQEAKTVEAKNKSAELQTAITKSSGENPKTVRISKELIGDNSELKAAWYADLVANATLVLSLESTPVEISQEDVISKIKILIDKTNRGSVAVSINDLLDGLSVVDLTKDQLTTLSSAVNSDGTINKSINWEKGQEVKKSDGTEVSVTEVLESIQTKITKAVTAERETDRKRAAEIISINKEGGKSDAEKQTVVLSKESAWDLVVDKDRKDIATSLKKQMETVSQEAKQKAKDYKKFIEEVNKLVLVPIMSKASTIGKTVLHGLKESMSDEDGNIKEEFADMFTDYAKTAKDEIEALANQAADKVESAKLTALGKVKKALDESIGKFVPGQGKTEKDVANALGFSRATTKENYKALVDLVNATADQTKVKFTADEISLLDPSKDGSNDFDKASNQFKRLIVISQKLLGLQQAQKAKAFDRIVDAGTKANLATLLNSDFANKVSKDLVSFLGNKQTSIASDVREIEKLESQVGKFNSLRSEANDDIWSLATGDHEHKSLIRDVLSKLQEGVKTGLRAVLRATGLYHEDNIAILQSRVDKMKQEEDTDETGMPKILKSALTSLMVKPSESSNQQTV